MSTGPQWFTSDFQFGITEHIGYHKRRPPWDDNDNVSAAEVVENVEPSERRLTLGTSPASNGGGWSFYNFSCCSRLDQDGIGYL